MLEILTYQVIAAGLGGASISAADWLYHRGRIRQRPHDLWVSASSTATCSPLLIWTTDVFLGIGFFSVTLIGAIAMITFLWIYRSLQKVPTGQELEWGGSFQPLQDSRSPPMSPVSTQTQRRRPAI
jgi:hypothetical protein